jgi:hypothetical protein
MTYLIRACLTPRSASDSPRGSEGTPALLPGTSTRTIAAFGSLLLLALVAAGSASGLSGPESSVRPTLTGHPTQGNRLTASPGSWSGSGQVAFAYQWYRCDTMGAHCTTLQGATERTRRLGPNDVGHTIGLQVRARDSSGSATDYTSLVGPIAGKPSAIASSAQPTVSGAPVLGATLHVGTGGWKPRPTSFSYQWARCNTQARACVPIAGATGDTHQVVADDLGHALVAIVQARSGPVSRAVFSAATSTAVEQQASSPPPAGTALPVSSTPPLVAEVIRQGSRLTGSTGSWSSSAALAYGYQWYRCDASGAHCKSIHGATQITYTQVEKDVGQTLGFAVTAGSGSSKTTAYASLVGPVAAAAATFASSGQPALTGTPTDGQTLQASTGNWTQTPASVTYQWQRCNPNGRLCTPIAGATAQTYTAGASDTGHALLVVVHASLGNAAQDALSLATRAIAPAPGPSSSAPPAVTGIAQQGKQLTGTAGTWSGSGTISYAFQWYRCDPTGAHCKSIHGATRATYTAVAADAGQTITLAVRATDANGTQSAYAGLAGLVAAAGSTVVATAQPAISGSAQQGQTLQVSNGTWSQAAATFTYQWQRCNPNGRLCTPITGATAGTYVVAPADAGHSLLAVVQATAGGVAQATLSTTTPPVH